MDFTLITVRVGNLFDGTQEKRPVHEMCNLKEEIVDLLQRAYEEQNERDKKIASLQEELSRLEEDLRQERYNCITEQVNAQETKFALDAAERYTTALKQDLELYIRALERVKYEAKKKGKTIGTPELTGLTEPSDIN